ncbi:DUF4265 domain-containing protein [Kutzneria sp. NPDC052558]|uniref:DUF4265 domain-containing protein n=1 Tax=Kutzneria sp. NPDC052558 TaxID=3364121 RepID=UPI0037C7C1FC
MSAEQIAEHEFRLTSAPVFAKRLAVGDVVRVVHYGPSRDPWIEEVLAWSGNSTIRVITFASGGRAVEEELSKGVEALGGTTSPSMLAGLFVVNVPKSTDYGRMRALLDEGEGRGVWEYEEAAISEHHAGELD